MSDADLERGRQAFWLTMIALLWAVVMIVGALAIPVNGTSGLARGGSASAGTHTTTLLSQNGPKVILVLAIPAGLALLVSLALHVKCTTGSRNAVKMVWWMIGGLSMFVLIAGFSVGLFALPVVWLLALAAMRTPSGPRHAGSAHS